MLEKWFWLVFGGRDANHTTMFNRHRPDQSLSWSPHLPLEGCFARSTLETSIAVFFCVCVRVQKAGCSNRNASD